MVDITTEITIDAEQLQNALAGDQEQAEEFIMLLDEAVADYDFTRRLFKRLGEAIIAENIHDENHQQVLKDILGDFMLASEDTDV